MVKLLFETSVRWRVESPISTRPLPGLGNVGLRPIFAPARATCNALEIVSTNAIHLYYGLP